MRKAQKQMALEFVQTLQEAHDEIRNFIASKQYIQALDVLVQCQQGAIELGNFIEETAGEGTRAVVLLEKYCEQVFGFYNELNEKKFTNVKICIRKLSNQIQEVENSINREISVRKEVVFFPYNASMWDSLESVYLTAKEDPDCDVYCVPIPFFERNADGSLGQMHYEGKEFPNNIEIYSYLDYSFEDRKPDVAYIHNPYDEVNRVTCVHPRFFSKNLKQHIEKLVYIPYYVGPEVDPSDQMTINKMKHFCFLPAVINADEVILQSENHRQVYINEYFRRACASGLQGKHIDRNALEQKFIAGGSPKFDKVLSVKKEDVDIPAEWLKLIEKEDGTWKKIIFYNTTIQAMLGNKERMLEKIKYVLKIFKDNRNEVVLLWRPHPLLEGTIKSMLPYLWEEYDAITKQYREDGWGIWDNSKDMNRAIAISDAYYGDQSSVLQVYQKTKKPVMVQNVDALPENSCSLAMDNIVEYQGEWWFLAFKENCIYRMNKDNLEVTPVVRIPWKNGNYFDSKEYGEVYLYNKKIFIIPWGEGDIVVYDIDKERIRYIECHKDIFSTSRKFAGVVQKESKLYLVPCKEKQLYVVDMELEEISYIRIGNSVSGDMQECIYGAGSIYCENNYIWVAEKYRNVIVRIDLCTGNIMEYQNDLFEGGCIGIVGNESEVWIIPRKTSRILCWSKTEKEVHIYDDFPTEYSSGEWSFHKIVWLDKLYLLPREANMLLSVNQASGKIEREEVPLEGRVSYYDRYLPYSCLWEMDNRILVIHSERGGIYDLTTNDEYTMFAREEIFEKLEGIQSNFFEKANRFENISGFMRRLI